MILKHIRVSTLVLLVAGATAGLAQNPPATQVPTIVLQPSAPEVNAPQKASPEKSAEAPDSSTEPAIAPKLPDKAAAYYHFMMAHMYEEMVSMYGRSDYANKAIEEYRAAIENDPSSDYLNAGLAELYARTGRIRDAVLEAQDILKRDGNNLEARRLLGQIYLRSLGDMQSGTQSQEILKLAAALPGRLDPRTATASRSPCPKAGRAVTAGA